MGGRKHEPGRTGSDAAGERIDLSALPPRAEPHVAAGGHSREVSGTNTDARQIHSSDRSPQPGPPPVRGSDDNDRQRKKAEIEETEVSQMNSRLVPDVKAMNSGLSGEVKRVYPSSPTEEPESM